MGCGVYAADGDPVRHRAALWPKAISINPANYGLEGWWRAPYLASPWEGNASQGNSGDNDLESASAPAGGDVLASSLTSVLFDGERYLEGDALSTYFATSDATVACLLKVDEVAADGAAGAGEILSDTGGVFSMGSYASGGKNYVVMYLLTAAGWGGASVEISLNEWQVVSFRFDGNYVSAHRRWEGSNYDFSRVVAPQSFSFSSAGTTTISSLTGTLRVGASVASANRFFKGQIADLILTNGVGISVAPYQYAQFSWLRYYANRYGLSL